MTDTRETEPTHQAPALTAGEAIELAYGLLWLMPDSPQNALGKLARDALRSQLDRDGKIRGVGRAQDHLAQIRRDAN
jgi:hypothetical protein